MNKLRDQTILGNQQELIDQHEKVLENLGNMKITEDDRDLTHQSISLMRDSSQQEMGNPMYSYGQQQSFSGNNQEQKSSLNNQQSVQQNLNESELGEQKSHNDSGLFFVTNPNFKSSVKVMTDEQLDKIQTNPDQYYDKQTEKISQLKSDFLKNKASIEEGKSIFKRVKIQQEVQIQKDAKEIEIGIESFLKRLTYNLQEQDQEMRYLSKQIDQQLADNLPTIRCLENFEKRVFYMEKEIGLVPEQQQLTQEEMKEQQIKNLIFQ